jgi:hypothetical protein
VIVRRRGMGDICPAGFFLDSSGAICLPNGTPDTSASSPLLVVNAANNPNFSMTVTAKAPPAPTTGGIDAKTLAYVIGGAFLFAMVAKK